MRAILAATLIAFALPLHANDQDVAGNRNDDNENQLAISTRKDGSLPVTQLAGKKVVVSFKNSTKLAEVIANRIENLGAQIVQSEDDADVFLAAEGQYRARREFGNRHASADIGDAFEKSGEVETKNRSFNIVIGHGGSHFTNAQATLILNFGEMLGEVTGVKSWFNTLIAGDPDGFCFKGCEYKQAATVTVAMLDRNKNQIGAATVTTEAEDKELKPLPLIESALNAMLNEFDAEHKSIAQEN